MSANFTLFTFNLSVVKEEITDDSAKLPCFNGRVISWVCVESGF